MKLFIIFELRFLVINEKIGVELKVSLANSDNLI